jgi:diguanylate cyclase (GGDEF)-like protein
MKKQASMPSVRRSLLRHEQEHDVDMVFVAEEAEDLPMSVGQRRHHKLVQEERGDQLYVDMLFVLTHAFFPREQAPVLWHAILEHKKELRRLLGRNPGVSVAALDYMKNLQGVIHKPVVLAEERLDSVAEVALRDGLTGLYDHSAFHTKLGQEIARFNRYGNEASIVLLDIDHFKRFNDKHGHRKGDGILRELADIIRSETRDLDVAARYGGEEFCIVLPHSSEQEAYHFAERLRRHVENRFSRNDRVTVSLGVANCPLHGKTAASLIDAADAAMYQAKADGRNRTVRASGHSDASSSE